jgi:hypothetical protein
LLNDKARDVLCVSATQVGKTFSLACWLLYRMWEYGGLHPYWWCAPTYPQVQAGCRLMVDLASKSGILRSERVSPFPTITLVNGSRCEFRSWEREQNLMGTSIAAGVIDEAGLLSPEAQAAISTRRSSTLGPLRYIGNPGVTAGPFRRLCALAEAPDHDPAIFSMHKWTWRDKAAALPPTQRVEYEAFIGQEKLSLPEYEFMRLYDAEWTEDEAAVFRGVDACIEHGNSSLLPFDADDFVLGVDVGQTNDYLVVASFGIKTRRIEIRDRFRGIGYPQAAERIQQLHMGLRHAIICVEANGPGVALIQELDRLGVEYLPFTTTNQSKQEIVIGLAADIQQKRVSIADHAPLPYELTAYRYERLPSGLYRYGAPAGEHDDCVMAACLARYAAIRSDFQIGWL